MSSKTDQTEELKETQSDADLILPIYIAVDRSWSMGPKDNNAIDAANELIPTIIDTCDANPLVDYRARFCIIGFNAEPEVVVTLSRGTNMTPHAFVADGGTDFSKVFALLKSQILSDHVTLKRDGNRSYRPAVFLITDGEPNDDPTEAFTALKDPGFDLHPNVFVFGVGKNISTETIKQYTDGRGLALATKDNVSAASALKEFISSLMTSIIQSTTQAGSAAAENGAVPDFTFDPEAFTDSDDIFILSDLDDFEIQ